MGATARLGENSILLNLTIEAFKRLLKRIAWIYFNFTHSDHQRDLRSLLRPDLCGW